MTEQIRPRIVPGARVQIVVCANRRDAVGKSAIVEARTGDRVSVKVDGVGTLNVGVLDVELQSDVEYAESTPPPTTPTNAVPRTFLVGYTVPDMDGVRDLCRALDVASFYEEFREAYEVHGPIALCSMYAKMCYRSLAEGKNTNVKGTRSIEKNVEGTINMKHGAVFEHVGLNFATIGCSRVFTHELVRHRAGTAFSQTSGRYCTPESAQMILPPEFEETESINGIECGTLADDFRGWLEETKKLVEGARRSLNVDDMPMNERKRWTSALRRVMPSGADNEMGWTVNIRSLRHTIEMRTSRHAEWEIRRVFTDVARTIEKRWPLMLYGGRKTLPTELDRTWDVDEWVDLRI